MQLHARGGLGCRLSPYSGSSVCDIRKDGRVPNTRGKGSGLAQGTEFKPVLYASAEGDSACISAEDISDI